MATAPTSRRLNLTRDQLSAFLTDQQQIRQFELLFSTVDTLQVIIGTDFEFQADNAAATANEALAQINALSQVVDLNGQAEALSYLAELRKQIQALESAPPFSAPPAVTPASPTTSVQFNNAGAFGGSANFTYTSGTNTLTTGNITGSGPAVGILAPALTIQPRAPTALEAAGGLNLITPNAALANGTAGQVSLLGGNGLGTGGGGGASLRSGNGGTNGTGGLVRLLGGTGFGTGSGGSFSAIAGGAQSSGNGGSCSFQSGGSIGSGNGGNITFTAGAATNGNGGSITFTTQFSGGAGVPRIKMDMGGGSDGVNDVPGEFEVYSSLSGTTIFQCSVDVVSYTGTIGFFGVTPVTQPTTATTGATFVVNSGGTIHPTSTFDGYTLAQVVRALRDLGILA
jgi:hypothetical protein